jgi:hypothetical protein
MNVEVGPALLWQILELRVHHGAALFCLPLEENKNEQRNAGITTSVRLVGNREICRQIHSAAEIRFSRALAAALEDQET